MHEKVWSKRDFLCAKDIFAKFFVVENCLWSTLVLSRSWHHWEIIEHIEWSKENITLAIAFSHFESLENQYYVFHEIIRGCTFFIRKLIRLCSTTHLKKIFDRSFVNWTETRNSYPCSCLVLVLNFEWDLKMMK